ncbi:hypothetical protein [Methanobacterium aggregans]|uniref:hypothetical protein n=1 Tax=Methanobacterium aggregans TaxID=1615586 RepID=UPI001FDA386C|nr:hypothetical protein [Methanobacterium aggregans]MBP2046479.1 hypothetical protein [Methanobacterium aggregans]
MGEEKYELRIPPGIIVDEISETIASYEVEVAYTAGGLIVRGELGKLESLSQENARMRIPLGVNQKELADVITEYELELEHTDFGPVLIGSIVKLDEASRSIVASLNERIKNFEGQ